MTNSPDRLGRLDGDQPDPESLEAQTDSDEGFKSRLLLPRVKIDLFVGTDEFFKTAELAMSDRMARRAEASMFNGDITTAITHYHDNPPAPIIIIENCETAVDIEQRLNALADLCPPSTKVILVGTKNDIVLYRDLMKMGVGDYLVSPIKPLELLDAIQGILEDNGAHEKLGHVLAFISARGGAGASTLSHNVAHELATSFSATTLLIDTDFGFGTAALQFDMKPPRTLSDAMREGEVLDADVLEGLVAWRDKRFGLLAAPAIPEGNIPSTPNAMTKVIDQARRIADYVVLDLPPSWQPHIVEALTLADSIAIIATPDLPGLHNLRGLVQALVNMRPNDPYPHLVLNKLPRKGKPLVSSSDFEKILNRKLSAIIPEDSLAMSASEMDGEVLAKHRPSSQVVPSVRELAAVMSGRPKREQAVKSSRNPIFSKLLRKGR